MKHFSTSALGKLAASTLLALGLAASGSPVAEPQLSDRIDSLFAAYAHGDGPGFAIGVVSHGQLVYAKGYGRAEIDQDRLLDSQTSFNIASLSKQFTGAAVALEIGAGRLSLEDDLADHWPDLPEAYSSIKIGHLVYMTSGLPEYYSLSSPVGGWASEDKFTVDDAISAVMGAAKLDYEPGSRWTYSNINYQLLAELASKPSGLSFAEYMDSRVFAALGMDATWVDAPIRRRNDKATNYVWDDQTGTWKEAPRLSPHYGGSGMFSSIDDLARWDIALHTEEAFGAGFTATLLSTRNFDHDKSNDAFGLVHGRYRSQPTLWYEGGDYGVSSYMIRLPVRDQTVICLANFGNARCAEKSRAIIDLLLTFDPDADFTKG